MEQLLNNMFSPKNEGQPKAMAESQLKAPTTSIKIEPKANKAVMSQSVLQPSTVNKLVEIERPLNEDLEQIDFDGIGDLDTIQEEFYAGLELIKRQFQEQVERAENSFDLKHAQLKVVHNKIIKNYNMYQTVHDRHQKQLDGEREKLAMSRRDWDDEKALIAQRSIRLGTEFLNLDVGGKHMKVSRSTITSVPGTLMEKMFSGRHELKLKQQDDGSGYILDRDGRLFENVINYLRTDRAVYPKFSDENDTLLFEAELDFWQIPTNNNEIENKRLKQKLNHDLILFLESEPDKAGIEARQKWHEIGAFQLINIVKNAKNPNINTELKFGYDPKYPNFGGQIENGQVNGIGRYIITNGIIYEGQIKNHQMHGYGRYIFTNGDVYEGMFANHKKHGPGRLIIARNGKTQVGNWASDKYKRHVDKDDEDVSHFEQSFNLDNIRNLQHGERQDHDDLNETQQSIGGKKRSISLAEFARGAFRGGSKR